MEKYKEVVDQSPKELNESEEVREGLKTFIAAGRGTKIFGPTHLYLAGPPMPPLNPRIFAQPPPHLPPNQQSFPNLPPSRQNQSLYAPQFDGNPPPHHPPSQDGLIHPPGFTLIHFLTPTHNLNGLPIQNFAPGN